MSSSLEETGTAATAGVAGASFLALGQATKAATEPNVKIDN